MHLPHKPALQRAAVAEKRPGIDEEIRSLLSHTQAQGLQRNQKELSQTAKIHRLRRQITPVDYARQASVALAMPPLMQRMLSQRGLSLLGQAAE